MKEGGKLDDRDLVAITKFLYRFALGEASVNEIAVANAFVLANGISVIRP